MTDDVVSRVSDRIMSHGNLVDRLSSRKKPIEVLVVGDPSPKSRHAKKITSIVCRVLKMGNFIRIHQKPVEDGIGVDLVFDEEKFQKELTIQLMKALSI